MKMHWDGRKCFLRFIRGTTQLDRHDAYPLCAGARTCFLDNGRTRLSLPAPPDLRPFRPRRFGKARSGVICHQAVLTGLTPSPARFPRLVLRRPHPCAFPFIIAAFSPFCKGDLQIFKGGTRGSASGLRQGRCPCTLQGSFSLDPFARLSCAFFHNICACCAGGSRLRAQPPAASKINPQRNEKPPRHAPQGDTFHLLEAAAFSGYNRFCSLRMQVK